jgi:hypothetical protein
LKLGVHEIHYGGYIANHPSDWEDGSNHYGQMLHFGHDADNHGYILLDRATQNMYFKNIHSTDEYGAWYKVAHSGNSSVTKSGETLTVKINGTSQSLTNTWRGIQNNLTSDSTTDSLSAAQGKALANGSARDNTKLSLSGGTLSGTLSFSNNIGISGIMGGGSDGWGIAGTGDGDQGRLKIYVTDNGTSDWLDFEFRDWSGTTYTPLSMTGNQIIFNYNPTVNGHSLIHTGNLPAYPTKASWNYDDRYVSNVALSGNYLRITKNGANTDLTIPYATYATTANQLNTFSIPFQRPTEQGGNGKQWSRLCTFTDTEITTTNKWFGKYAIFEMYTNGYGDINKVYLGRVSFNITMHGKTSFKDDNQIIRCVNLKKDSISLDHFKVVITDTTVEFFVKNDIWDTMISC